MKMQGYVPVMSREVNLSLMPLLRKFQETCPKFRKRKTALGKGGLLTFTLELMELKKKNT